MSLEGNAGIRYDAATPSGNKLYVGVDGTVYMGDKYTPGSGLYNNVTGNYENSATITFTLKDSSLVNVTGAVAIAMTLVSGSNGCYEGTLESTVTITSGSTYHNEITSTVGTTVDLRRITYTAEHRGA